MELFPVSESDLSEIIKEHGTNDEEIKANVKMIEEWLKKQPHLPQKFQYDDFLPKLLSDCKFSVERTKHKLERHFTFKGLNKDLYEIFASKDYITPKENSLVFVPMPKLGPQKERILIGFVKDIDPDKFEFNHMVQIAIELAELTLRYDKTNRLRLLFDCQKFTLDILKKFEIVKMHRLCNLFFQIYVTRLVAVDLCNTNPAIKFLMQILRKVIIDKIFQRIQFHANLDALHESIPKDYLPKEFGGTQESMFDIEEKLDSVVENHRKFLMDIVNYTADESLRVGPCEYSHQMFGLDGTFKQLNLD